MSSLIQARRNLRRRMRENKPLDRYTHLFVTLVLISNMLLILYALISVTLRMTLSGVGFLDSLPIALYILPLLIFLPFMTRAFYRERTAAWNFVFLMVCTIFFVLLSLLVRGFLIALAFNISAAILLFIMGRFRPKGSLKSAGKKGLAYVILLNMLGLSFPISTIIMGQTPIDSAAADTSDIFLEMPLNDFDFSFVNISPEATLFSSLESLSFNLDFKLNSENSSSWSRLGMWLTSINGTSINYTVTLSCHRGTLAGPIPQVLGTTDLLEAVYDRHFNAIDSLSALVDDLNITRLPELVTLDMTLSHTEWKKLMVHTRSLDLIGFSGLMRRSLDSFDYEDLYNVSNSVREYGESVGFNMGILVDPFALDDLQDSDTLTMMLCGQTVESLVQWEHVDVQCSRSKFSYEMQGDVGEYMVNSYARSIARLGDKWAIRMSEIGNRTDREGRTDSVYTTMEEISRDLTLASGHGVQKITIGSLSSLLASFGNGSLSDLRNAIDEYEQASATYTFRIYAFRAVFIAIDAFDFIML